jgi:predicted AlkP superfamily pyrophosphatase or phosphodiesterase
MPAQITATSLGVLVNGQYTLADVNDMFDILDEESDFGERVKSAIADKFQQITTDHLDAFLASSNGVLRPDVIMIYINQMQMANVLLGTLYPQYLAAVQQAQQP